MERIDITCTATLRPKLLKRTLESHIEHLFKDNVKNCRLIINIDNAGSCNPNDDFGKVISVAKSFDFQHVSFNVSETPHFGKAFLRCMRQVRSELFFHLEEDWEMKFDIDFEKMISLFNKDPSLAHLRLSMFRSEEKTCKNWNKFLDWNGEYFEVKPEERGVIGWAGHPSMNRTSFMKAILPAIDAENNPEKQIKHKIHPLITKTIDKFKFGSFHPQNSLPAIEDIGRRWMVENGWVKAGNKAWFTQWEKEKTSE